MGQRAFVPVPLRFIVFVGRDAAVGLGGDSCLCPDSNESFTVLRQRCGCIEVSARAFLVCVCAVALSPTLRPYRV